MSRWLVCIVLLVAAATVVFAQSKTTGGLRGLVTSEGTPVPGASVEITSASMIGGKRVTQTDVDGRWRFAELPPGSYTVTVIAVELNTQTLDAVKVPLGKTVYLPVEMKPTGGSMEINVESARPEIDVTSAATSTTLPSEVLSNLPVGRFQVDVINLAPGINESSAFGGGADAANAYQLDGVDTSDPEGGTPWSFINYSIVDEVQLVGLGAPAEYGQFTGVVFNSTTKSGGNDLSGEVELYYTNESLTSKNVPGNVDITPPTIDKAWDFSAQIGGPIRKDKLWYFANVQSYGLDESDGGPIREERSPRAFGKLSWQVNPSSKLEGWLEYDEYNIKGRGGDASTPLEATVREDAPEWVWNLSWQKIVSDTTIINATIQGYTGYYYLNPERGYDIPGEYDGVNYSKNSYYFYLADRDRNQLNASISHHAADFIMGSHDFKYGMELERSVVRSRYGYTTGKWIYNGFGDDPGTKEEEGCDGCPPAVPYATSYYGNGYDVGATNKRLSLFAQDAWQITPNFTLNPGVRVDINRGTVQGSTPYSTEPIALRLGLAWNPDGQGKTLFKAHYGRYYEKLNSTYYYYVDKGAFEPGYSVTNWPSGFVDESAVTGKRYSIDPDLKHPYLDQWIAGFDRELPGAFTLGATLIYRKNSDFIETVGRRQDFSPVEGFIPNENEDSPIAPVTLYEYTGGDIQPLRLENAPGLFRRYRGVLLTATRRLRDNWQLNASYVYSKVEGNFDNNLTNSYGPSSFLDSPNSLINADGKLTHDQTHEVKLQGTWLVPRANLSFSWFYTYYSGDNWTRRARCILVDNPDDPGTFDCQRVDGPGGARVRYFAETRGSRRFAPTNTVDLRLSWNKPIGNGSLELIADIFNAFNRGVATDIEDRDGGSFGQPLSWSTPRNIRLGVRYGW
ncbi:MAG: TonB-dependent receptor [Acidobacteriota bacterium]